MKTEAQYKRTELKSFLATPYNREESAARRLQRKMQIPCLRPFLRQDKQAGSSLRLPRQAGSSLRLRSGQAE